MPAQKVDVDRLKGRIRDHYLTYGHDPERWRQFEKPEALSAGMFYRHRRAVRDRLIRDGLLEPKGRAKSLTEPEDVKRVKEVATL